MAGFDAFLRVTVKSANMLMYKDLHRKPSPGHRRTSPLPELRARHPLDFEDGPGARVFLRLSSIVRRKGVMICNSRGVFLADRPAPAELGGAIDGGHLTSRVRA